MNVLRPRLRSVALAGLLAISPVALTPALAAKADVELLKSYVGDWRGKGALVGAESETVICKLVLSPGNADKVNYSGRCALAGTNLAVNGTLAYNDAARRFEAAMTSNVTFSGLAVGKKQGDGIVFNLRERNKDEEGNDLTVTAAIALKGAGKNIVVEFQVVFNATGDTLKASIPFSK
ncbi:hypothetical protein VW23_023805 [Devosia insulae DS-56]|uniref:THAP4-like heme-binding beta-barrel domain-containing protein n=1 Tax=Devosia insulae DS-56 TaxID=1116389 RepID=A0A1E5XMW7_9HYPH|nr:hypothetical protein [Devosia insulae]OEO29915.1 hypothetical protein VW23_023805 [Devosia insulae DS-56]